MSVTCIIPAYNEGPRIGYVLTQLMPIKVISQIIVVDDGSTDETSLVVRKFSDVKLIRHTQNLGKSESIKTGLKLAKNNEILLFDADLSVLVSEEITRGIHQLYHLNLDMLLFRLDRDKWPQRLVRSDILFTGMRILNKSDLVNILNSKISRYQLELAINDYMTAQHKIIAWTHFSGLNTLKTAKNNDQTLLSDLRMYWQIASYRWLHPYLKAVFLFNPKSI